MTYARARLWTGITGVGLVVVASALALIVDLPGRLLAAETDLLSSLAGLAALAGALSVLLLPVEWVGGVLLPRRHGRAVPGALAWWGGWLRGLLAQLAVLSVTATAVLLASAVAGRLGAILALAAIMILLVGLQPFLARFVGGLRRSGPRIAGGVEVEVFVGRDPAFTGGIAGWPGRDRIIVPERWFETIEAAGVGALARRRDLIRRRGWRTRGLLAAAAFNLAGFAGVLVLGDLDPARPADLATAWLGTLLVSFLGLLVLPGPARRAVRAGDRAALEAGVERDLFAKCLERLDPDQDDEPERSAALESVFHPLRSLRGRLRDLDETTAPRGGSLWHVARNALFLSWAGFGVLARAVHCNSGKPELWVLLPCD